MILRVPDHQRTIEESEAPVTTESTVLVVSQDQKDPIEGAGPVRTPVLRWHRLSVGRKTTVLNLCCNFCFA